MKDKGPNILLVEDDTSLGYLLTEYLQLKELNVNWATDGKKALKLLETAAFDLAILDVMMPEMDGFALAASLRSLHPDLPFIFLTAKSLKIDVLKGFSLGAVDYLKKPIDEEELVVRINTLLARIGPAVEPPVPRETYVVGSYTFNSRNQELRFGSEVTHLTSRESELLQYLVQRTNQLCSHKEILMALWGRYDYFNKKSLNVFITHLRKYLEKDPAIRIENVHGQGFILREGEMGG
jgi:DNA-binding response OmpR family regulator